MDLTFRLKEGKTIHDAAIKVQQFNTIAADLLVNGPIPCNPDSDQTETMIGDICTPANELGYVNVRINNYRKLILDPQMLGFFADTFEVVYGFGGDVDENGNYVTPGAFAK